MLKDYQVCIVLADDNDDDREFFTRAVRNTSPVINLVTLNDGVNLMEYLESDPKPRPNMVILDINMPRLSGLECLQKIRESSQWKDLPVVIYTATFNELDQSLKYGANLYVKKPNNISALNRVVNYVVTIDWSRRKPYSGNILFKDLSII